jgi:MOSC domain-containing protein YiiM
LTSDKVSRALVHRGGLRCDVLTEGIIRVGDTITIF